MKSKIQILFFFFLIYSSVSTVFAQEIAVNNTDSTLKESLYKKYKNEVRAYDRKKFDDLFFEYFQKSSDNSVVLTKEEFYMYTVKIAIYSEKLGLLYKDQKSEAQKAKQDWFDKNYSDYLNSKK